MYNKRRLHPAAIVLSIFKNLKDLVFPLIILFFIGNSDTNGLLVIIKLAGLSAILLGIVIRGILAWYRFTYSIENGVLLIESGVFIRKKRYIPSERIQTIDVKAGLIHRLFHLVALQIETASGGSEAEAELSTISVQEAEEIKRLLTEKKVRHPDVSLDENNKIITTISQQELFVHASTSGGIGVILSAIVAFISQFDELIPYESLYHKFEATFQINVMFFIILGMIGLILAWLLSFIATLLKYGKFTLERQETDLIISAGLLEKRQLMIPLSKIQAIRIAENPVRQLFGFATVYIESAGSSSGSDTNFSTVLLPIVKLRKMDDFLLKFVPEYKLPEHFISLPKRSLNRYLFRAVFPIVPIVVVLIYFFHEWGLLSLILIFILLMLGYLRHKDAGLSINQTAFSIKYRFFSKFTVLMRKNRIQDFEASHSFFQKRNNLQTIQVSIKTSMTGRKFRLIDIDQLNANELLHWFSKAKKGE